MLGKLSMIGAVAAIIMIPHSAVRPSRGRFPRVDDSTALSWCVELCQALPTKAHHPKLAAGAPSKLPTARIAWPGRSDPSSAWMFRTDARQAKCAQGLVPPWRWNAFRPSVQGAR
jgi:hypothetical protein